MIFCVFPLASGGGGIPVPHASVPISAFWFFSVFFLGLGLGPFSTKKMRLDSRTPPPATPGVLGSPTSV